MERLHNPQVIRTSSLQHLSLTTATFDLWVQIRRLRRGQKSCNFCPLLNLRIFVDYFFVLCSSLTITQLHCVSCVLGECSHPPINQRRRRLARDPDQRWSHLLLLAPWLWWGSPAEPGCAASGSRWPLLQGHTLHSFTKQTEREPGTLLRLLTYGFIAVLLLWKLLKLQPQHFLSMTMIWNQLLNIFEQSKPYQRTRIKNSSIASSLQYNGLCILLQKRYYNR